MFGVFLLGSLALVLGLGLLARWSPPGSREFRWSIRLVVGIVAIHCWLLFLAAIGVAWGFVSIGLLAVIACCLAIFRRADLRIRGESSGPFTVGDLLAVGGIAVFAFCALNLWITNSDFFHHWGAKGQRFFLTRGIDYAYLARPWNDVIVPWYPTLAPELFGLSAVGSGEFRESSLMIWSVIWLTCLVVAGREIVVSSGVNPRTAGWFAAGLAAFLAVIGIELRLAGSPDLIISLGICIASVELFRPVAQFPGAAVVASSALMASTKVEGVVLALVVLGVDCLRRARAGAFRWRSAMLAALPTVVVSASWLMANRAHGLYRPLIVQGLGDRTLTLRRAAEVAAAIGAEFQRAPLFGLPFLILLLPLALLLRRSRWVALVVLLGSMFYACVYLTSPADPNVYVRTTVKRLVFHFVPALVAATLAAGLAYSQEELRPRTRDP